MNEDSPYSRNGEMTLDELNTNPTPESQRTLNATPERERRLAATRPPLPNDLTQEFENENEPEDVVPMAMPPRPPSPNDLNQEFENEQKREAIHGSLPSLRSSPYVETSLPPSIVYDVIELEEKPISAYKYSATEENFPILFADKNDYKVIMRLDLEKVLRNTNNIMYECKPKTPFGHLAITRNQVRPTAYLQTSVLGIQTASVGVVELSSIQKTIKSLKERMDHNRKQTQKKLSAIKSTTSARKKALLDTKIMPYIYKLIPIKNKKLDRLASKTVLLQKGVDFAVSANHCQNMAPVQVYKLIKVKGKNASKKRSASKTVSANQTRNAKRTKRE